MKLKKISLFGFIFIMLIFSTLACSSAMEAVEQGNVLEHYTGFTQINNNNAPGMVKKPSPYESSPGTAKGQTLETKKNTIKTQKGVDYTFKTEYFLPLSWKKSGDWANAQSVVVDGKYMYILVLKSKKDTETKGFIARYDMDILNKYHANVAGKTLSDLRGLALNSNKGSLTSNQKNLKTGIKSGSTFTVGHGQSLAYNPQTPGYLWMWEDVGKNDPKLLLIKQSTLKPVKAYNFRLEAYGRKVAYPNNLAFDNDGYFYYYQIQKNPSAGTSPGSLKIFIGKIVNDKVQMKISPIVIKNRPGYYSQSISYNPANDRLYLISDGAFTTLPVKNLRNNQLSVNDIQYTVLKSKREIEGIAFDKKGYGYLLTSRAAEILKTTKAFKELVINDNADPFNGNT